MVSIMIITYRCDRSKKGFERICYELAGADDQGQDVRSGGVWGGCAAPSFSLFRLVVAAVPPQPAGNQGYWMVGDLPNLLPGRRARKP